jgi:hypothetical protein
MTGSTSAHALSNPLQRTVGRRQPPAAERQGVRQTNLFGATRSSALALESLLAILA